MVIMEIFGIGPLEFLLIIIIMLLVLGPEEMLNTARKIGAFIRQIVRSPMWGDVMDTSREIRNLPNRIIQETGLEDDISEIKQVAQGSKEMLDGAAKQLMVEMEPIAVPKIDIKSAVSSPDKTESSQANTSSIDNDQVIDSEALSPDTSSESIEPAASPTGPATGDEEAVPLQVEYETAPINSHPGKDEETIDSTPHPLAVEFEEPAPVVDLVEEQQVDLVQPADPAPVEETGAAEVQQPEAVKTPPTKRRTRKTRKSSEDDPSTASEKLIAESMTPHENGRSKNNG